MGLQFNAAEARKADTMNMAITDSGKYVGTITRAEKLLSRNKVEGFGLSFRADDGSTANYLDLYTVKPDGEKLRGYTQVQSLLCCLRMREVEEGNINFEKWDNELRRVITATAPGYPQIMGKKIGLVLQRELQTHSQTGADVERMSIVTIFEPSTGLSASEILDGKTTPERVAAALKMIERKPVRDSRKPGRIAAAAVHGSAPAGGKPDFDDDIPF